MRANPKKTEWRVYCRLEHSVLIRAANQADPALQAALRPVTCIRRGWNDMFESLTGLSNSTSLQRGANERNFVCQMGSGNRPVSCQLVEMRQQFSGRTSGLLQFVATQFSIQVNFRSKNNSRLENGSGIANLSHVLNR